MRQAHNANPRIQMNDEARQTYLTVPLAIMYALASGLAVGNLYWAQPLLAQIAQGFGVATTDAGVLATVTQIGYALGVLLLVPLGDIVSRKVLIPTVMGASVVTLVASACAPGLALMACALGFLGVTTVSGQIIIPFSREASRPSEVGKMAGIVASGFTTGILLSRMISGLVASIAGWRSVFIMAAVLNLIMAIIVARFTPCMPARERIPYPKLIASVFQTAARAKGLLPIMVTNGLAFLAFNMFWVSLTYLLSSQPFGFNTFQIGLVSLAGLVGAASSAGIGTLLDRGHSTHAIAAMAALMTVSFALLAFGATTLAIVVIGAALLSVGAQGLGILTQTRAMGLVPGATSRLNTAFVVSNNIFSAIGCAVAAVFWNGGGWVAVAIAGAAFMAIAFMTWIACTRREKKGAAEL